VRHLRVHHNVTMEPSKLGHPSTQEQGPRIQDHEAMNVWVLSNPLACFHHNEQKAIVKVKRHAFLEWDGLQVDF
jgi:hypothetical protein